MRPPSPAHRSYLVTFAFPLDVGLIPASCGPKPLTRHLAPAKSPGAAESVGVGCGSRRSEDEERITMIGGKLAQRAPMERAMRTRVARMQTQRRWRRTESKKAFEPNVVEEKIQERWRKLLAPEPMSQMSQMSMRRDDGRPFSMILPPPNVTGKLHLGHAVMLTIQDAIVRWQRMKGREAMWIPGLDHAGIATQSVVEKRLMKEQGLSRHDLGRCGFVSQLWDWKEAYGENIKDQVRRMGASVNWEREYFTLDEERSRAVTEAFVQLFEKGMIYRDFRHVNWSPALSTALSDLEVDLVSIETPTLINVPREKEPVLFGEIYHIRYPIENPKHETHITVSTTRPETIFGDVAIAVHSSDKRYQGLIGSTVVHPFSGKLLPILADDILVDPTLGSGAVKITPAHDSNDFECAKRHGLEYCSVITEDGNMNDECGEFSGNSRFECRQLVLHSLDEQGLLQGVEPYPMRVPMCSRSGDIIEPMLKPQWYVSSKTMAERAIDLVDKGAIQFNSEDAVTTWKSWLDNIQDWCISRQLWWGHRIPAYQVVLAGKDDKEEWVAARSLEEAHNKANGKSVIQDEDVLDTWFSSALLPLSCAGWPEKVDKDFYPSEVLETGKDILFFWVARMVMLCTEFVDDPPFKFVVLHPMVRDKDGRKMSKSLGNVIDPLHVIDGITRDEMIQTLENGNLHPKELKHAIRQIKSTYSAEGIPACGADALRLALASYLEQTEAINMDIQQVIIWKRFCNKLWNAVAFCSSHDVYINDERSHVQSLEERWIVSRLHHCVKVCNDGFEKYDLGAIASALRFYVYDELCGVYLESCKPHHTLSSEDVSNRVRVLRYCLEATIRLCHPLAPFITEELWIRLLKLENYDKCLVQSTYPEGGERFLDEEKDMEIVLQTVQAARSLKERLLNEAKQYRLQQKLSIYTETDAEFDVLSRNKNLLLRLLRINGIPIHCEKPSSEGLIQTCHGGRIGVHAAIELAGEGVDSQFVEASLSKVATRQEKLQKQLAAVDAVLASKGFLDNAPFQKVEAQRVKQAQLRSEIEASDFIKQTLEPMRNL